MSRIFNEILGGFFRPSKWRRGKTESRFQQHFVFCGQHREWAPGAGHRHQPWGRRPWQKKTSPRIIYGGRFNVWIHDQWWQKLNDIWTNWFVKQNKKFVKKQCYMNSCGNLTSFFAIYWRKCRLNDWIHNQWWQKLSDIWTYWFVKTTKIAFLFSQHT